MNVAVYFAQAQPSQRLLMIVPVGTEPEVPTALREYNWRHMVAAKDLSDRLLAPAGPIIEAEININGYALMRLSD
ncbi:MAG: hypothetical protein WBA73_11585 [Devosia sp.]